MIKDHKTKNSIKIFLKKKNHNVQKSLEWVSNKVDEIVIGSKNQQQLIQNFNLINN